jgi:hypothetical protein
MKTKRVCGTALLAAIAAALVVLTLPAWAAGKVPEVGDKLPDTVMQQVPPEWQSGGFIIQAYDATRAPWHRREWSLESADVGYYPVLLLYRYDTDKRLAEIKKNLANFPVASAERMRVAFTQLDSFTTERGFVPERIFVRDGRIQLVGLKELPCAAIPEGASAQLLVSVETPPDVPFVRVPFAGVPPNASGTAMATAGPVELKITLRRAFGSRHVPIKYRLTASYEDMSELGKGNQKYISVPIADDPRDVLAGNEVEISAYVPQNLGYINLLLEYEVEGVVLEGIVPVHLRPSA